MTASAIDTLMINAACNPCVSRPAAREPKIATPSTLPVCRAVFRVPAATPERAGSTEPSNAEVMIGTIRPRPNPTATSWATSAP